MYNYPSMNKQENIINIWCINNNVRINPVPTKPGGYPEEWRIEVRLGYHIQKVKKLIYLLAFYTHEIYTKK